MPTACILSESEAHFMPVTQNPNFAWNWRLALACVAGAVLLAPALAMTFSNEVRWGREDFVAAAALFVATWVGLEIVLRLFKARPARIIGASAVVVALLAVWAQLAVGIL
jgi:hypothetical protein